MTSIKPFSQNRFEYEPVHLYYLDKSKFPQFEEPKSIFVVGTRGTGKTTLLKALNWEERLRNSHLKESIGASPFAKCYIGVYIKTLQMKFPVFGNWLQSVDKDLAISVTCLYFDLIWTEVLFDAVSKIVLEPEFNYSISKEYEVTEEFLRGNDDLRKWLDANTNVTFLGLRNAVSSARKKLEEVAESKMEISAEYINKHFPDSYLGNITKNAGKCIEKYCYEIFKPKKSKWHFKLCMDESECLSEFQQKVLNTIVRVSEWPIFFVVSYVNTQNTVSSLVGGMTLQVADRNIVDLEEMSLKEFRQLCEGVAAVRLQYTLNKKRVAFNLDKILGKLNINLLIRDILRHSENISADELLKKAASNKGKLFFGRGRKVKQEDDVSIKVHGNVAPIYQTYLIGKLNLSIDYDSDDTRYVRKITSEQIRKKMVSAYLCICKEYKQVVRYAFSDMVIQISDLCIRDFLLQLHELYEEAALPSQTFIKRKMRWEKQDKALKRAGQNKHERLDSEIITSPLKTKHLVDGLAKITSVLQTQGPDEAALHSTERGYFKLLGSIGNKTDLERIERLIFGAADEGYLVVRRNGNNELMFRVHGSLSPFYEFSYRRPYYTVTVKTSELALIMDEENPKKYEANVVSLGKKLAGFTNDGTVEDLPLFKRLKDDQ